ncbi:g7308 [Coccomyxa elongata]
MSMALAYPVMLSSGCGPPVASSLQPTATTGCLWAAALVRCSSSDCTGRPERQAAQASCFHPPPAAAPVARATRGYPPAAGLVQCSYSGCTGLFERAPIAVDASASGPEGVRLHSPYLASSRLPARRQRWCSAPVAIAPAGLSGRLRRFPRAAEKLTEGNELIEAKKMPRPHLFTRGVQEAKELWDLIVAAAKEGAEAEKGAHREALAALAATSAAAANVCVRCGYCEACLATQGASRRCLVNRAAAAAAGGHSGAQVAVAGDSAIGARISMWWPLDEDWYTGFVTAFDPTPQRHTICYDDGDVEIVCLWAPNQLARVVTDPGEWPKEAERIASEQNLHTDASPNQQRRAGPAAAQDPHDPPAIMLDTPPLNEFEQRRVDNITRNHNMLANLGSPLAAEKHVGPATLSAQGKQAAGASRSKIEDQQVSAGLKRTGVTLARDSKGRFIGCSTSRRCTRVAAVPGQSSGDIGSGMPILSSERAAPGTVNSLQSSGMTVPVVEGSLAPSIACGMATWMQHEARNVENVVSMAAGQRHAGHDQQAAEHAQEGPCKPRAAGSNGDRAALCCLKRSPTLGCQDHCWGQLGQLKHMPPQGRQRCCGAPTAAAPQLHACPPSFHPPLRGRTGRPEPPHSEQGPYSTPRQVPLEQTPAQGARRRQRWCSAPVATAPAGSVGAVCDGSVPLQRASLSGTVDWAERLQGSGGNTDGAERLRSPCSDGFPRAAQGASSRGRSSLWLIEWFAFFYLPKNGPPRWSGTRWEGCRLRTMPLSRLARQCELFSAPVAALLGLGRTGADALRSPSSDGCPRAAKGRQGLVWDSGECRLRTVPL